MIRNSPNSDSRTRLLDSAILAMFISGLGLLTKNLRRRYLGATYSSLPLGLWERDCDCSTAASTSFPGSLFSASLPRSQGLSSLPPSFRFSWLRSTKIIGWLYPGGVVCVTGCHVTSRDQGLSSNDQGRQRRETLGTRLQRRMRKNAQVFAVRAKVQNRSIDWLFSCC